MPVTRRTYDDLHARYEAQVEQATAAEKARDGAVSLAARTQRSFDCLARVVATYIVTADENGIDISPGDLRAAIERARINLHFEYARAGETGATP